MSLENLIKKLKNEHDEKSLKNIINLMEDHVCQVIAERLLLGEKQVLSSNKKEVETFI